ncbi:hypothetical protein OIA45_02505 [Streptomyces chartreusis]|uniref:hypothetical protein n=1 Tax=Streptomyces chartreusis TaxID=1969 RepID=UPI003865B138|nr:hypothetical protein OIA45_02505 [Streptomyces chartreusis]
MTGIDLVNGMVGAVCGMVVAILFQQSLQDAWFRLRRRFATRVRSLTYREDGSPLSTWSTFSIGPLHTSALIVEGDGEQAIAPESVQVRVLDGEAVLPEEMAPWRAEIEAAEQQAEETGTRVRTWNGPRYAVEGLEISRTALEEQPEVLLRLRPTDYFTFLAAQQLDRRLPDGTTPRGRYLDPDRPLDAPAFLQCSFGVNVAVVTADHLLVVSHRAHNVRSGPGLWGSSVNEGLSRHIDSAGRSAPDLHEVARRGMREELSLEPHEYMLTMLAFVLDVERRQWSAHFIAHLTNLRGETLRSRMSRGVADRWEHQSIEYVPFRPADVVRYLLRPDRIRRWAAVSPALYHLALVHTHGRSAVERAEAQVLRRLN